MNPCPFNYYFEIKCMLMEKEGTLCHFYNFNEHSKICELNNLTPNMSPVNQTWKGNWESWILKSNNNEDPYAGYDTKVRSFAQRFWGKIVFQRHFNGPLWEL